NAAMGLSLPDYRDIGKLEDAVAGIAAYSTDHYNFTSTGEPRDLEVARTTGDLFSVLGVSPAVGRAFTADETQDRVAVISHALWLASFGGDKSALGRAITLDDTSFTVVGVMPAGFTFPDASTDAWIPIGFAVPDPAMAEMRAYRPFSTVARLAPGASLAKLRGDLDLLGKRITASGQATSKFGGGETLDARLLRDAVVGNARQPLLILFGAVALVLLIACVNAANLLVARANAREKEFAVRRALGAGRWTIVRQLLVESVLLALGAAALGLALASTGLRLLAAQLPHGYVAGIDGPVLGFTALLAVATGLGFGIVPALHASKAALEQSLRDSAGGTVGRTRRRARDVLVVSEVALALVLLVGSTLLVRSFIGVSTIDPGFDPQGVLAARIRLSPAKYSTGSRKRTFYDDLLQRLRAQPGVRAVTIADGLPLAHVFSVGMNPQGIRPDDPDQFMEMDAVSVGPEFFATMHIPILQGRAITAEDRADSKHVVVVSQALAHRLWPDRNPVGQTGLGRAGDATVVGVAGNVRSETLERDGKPAIYVPLAQSRDRNYDDVWVIVRSAHPLRVAPTLRQVVRAEDAGQPIAEITTYDAIVQQRYASLELITALITLFAGLALVLAVIGIAGVTAYAVSQRTRELGIRIAMGARAVDVLGLLLNETVVLVAIGLGLGIAAAFAVTRTLRSLLYGVTSTDLLTFGSAALVLGAVALLATYVPARRAARVNPMEALRRE
ncbi:MAG TPA: ABC transporter permease, partial [Gemmatimonadales bacterium]|nr:ABC transporter permease [Gemmatimonadales bacterium]